MRAQLIELMAPSLCFALNSLSEKSALTMSCLRVRCESGAQHQSSHLAIVECSFDSHIKDVCICHGRHLSLLDRRYPSLRVEDEDGDILLPSQPVDGGTEEQFNDKKLKEQSEADLPVSPLVAPTTVSLCCCPSPDEFFLFKKNSNRLPRNWRATSLNANVGPCQSSSTKMS